MTKLNCYSMLNPGVWRRSRILVVVIKRQQHPLVISPRLSLPAWRPADPRAGKVHLQPDPQAGRWGSMMIPGRWDRSSRSILWLPTSAARLFSAITWFCKPTFFFIRSMQTVCFQNSGRLKTNYCVFMRTYVYLCNLSIIRSMLTFCFPGILDVHEIISRIYENINAFMRFSKTLTIGGNSIAIVWFCFPIIFSGNL